MDRIQEVKVHVADRTTLNLPFNPSNPPAIGCNIAVAKSCLVKTMALIAAYGGWSWRSPTRSMEPIPKPSTLRKQPIQAASSATEGDGRSVSKGDGGGRGETRRRGEAARERRC
ncbi:hypothetical protein Y032_0081g1485 [Ancylostoma ceylanicum]|uniref:Uncharacterized protein n=1 Tax=Ancylostoma ceylanicum TaxID=53326 RepID=A0A016TSM9_9BILA|nr:hypothetical protein Y032_0081g1485 [Ancylostoma ceylanicum]